MIVNFDEYSSIPNTIKRYIVDNEKDFINEREVYPVDRYSIAQSYDENKIQRHKNKFMSLFEGYKVLAGHYSRIYDINQLSEGLRVLRVEEHMRSICNIVREYNQEHIYDNEIESFKEYMLNLDNYLGGPRKNLLSFYYPVSDGDECKHYTEAIGGEVIKFGRQYFPNIYQLMCSKGISVKIIASVPYEYINEHFKDVLIDNTIRRVLYYEESNCDKVDWMGYEIRSTKDILCRDIIEIDEL